MSVSKRKGRPVDPSSYYSLLDHYNRDMSKAEKTQCECGKILFRSQLESHKTTKMHEQLLRYKQLAEQGANLMDRKKEDESSINSVVGTTEQPQTKQKNETIDELLLRVATDLEYRRKVRLFLNTLEHQPYAS